MSHWWNEGTTRKKGTLQCEGPSKLQFCIGSGAVDDGGAKHIFQKILTNDYGFSYCVTG